MLRNKIWTIVVLAVFAMSLAGRAAASDVDLILDLLVKKQVVSAQEASALRAEFAAQNTAGKALPTATVALVAQSAPAATSKEAPVTGATPIKLSGWAQTRWTDAVGASNPIELKRARLQVAGNLSPKLAYKVQADLVRSPALLDARGDYSFSPLARITVGQFKIPFSQENLVSSRDLIPIERSAVGNGLVPGRDMGSSGRDIGAQLEGTYPPENGQPLLDYSVGVFNGAGINRRDDNRRKDVAVRLVAHLGKDLLLAGDYYNGSAGNDGAARDRAGFELAYSRPEYSARGEYIWGRDGAQHKQGGYGVVSYRFQPKWEGLFRFDRYEPTSAARSDTYLLGLTWYFSPWATWQANYGVVNDNARTNNTQTVLTQLEFQF